MDKNTKTIIREELKENKISEITYARTLAALYFTDKDEMDAIHFVKGVDEWRKGNSQISEIKMIGLIANVCDTIKEVVRNEWDDSIFSSLLSEKVLKKIEASLSDVETVDSAKKILKLSSDLMSFGDDGDYKWGEDAEAES